MSENGAAKIKSRTKLSLSDRVLAGIFLFFFSSWGIAIIRGPQKPPVQYTPASLNQIAAYSDKNVELKVRPALVHYDISSQLEIFAEQDDNFFKTQTVGFYPPLIKFYSNNGPSREKQEELYNILRKKIQARNKDYITVRGLFNGDFLELYSVVIDGKEHSVLKH